MDEGTKLFKKFEDVLDNTYSGHYSSLDVDFLKVFPKSAAINTRINRLRKYLDKVKELVARCKEYEDKLSLLLKAGLSDLFVTSVAVFGEVAQSDGATPLLDELLEAVNITADSGSKVQTDVVAAVCGPFLQLLIENNCTLLQKTEICRSLNILLEPCPFATKETLLKQQDFIDTLRCLVDLVIRVGDYEFQIGILECLFRLVPRKVRRQYACKFIQPESFDNFLDIRDVNFETDCRVFLNELNKTVGKNNRVYSIPCEKAILGNKKLKKPCDDDYEKFWVDFNYGTRRITLFCEQDMMEVHSEDSQGLDLWETVSVSSSDVKAYSYTEERGTAATSIVLKEDISILYPNMIQCSGSEFDLFVPLKYDLKKALMQVFGSEKCTTRKVSSVINPVQLNSEKDHYNAFGYQSQNGYHMAETLQGTMPSSSQRSNDECTPARRKVSVPCVPMSTPARLVESSSTSSTAETKVSPRKPDHQRQQKANQSFHKSMYTDSDLQGRFIAPKTPTGKVQRPKVKTPVVEIKNCPKKVHREKRKKNGKNHVKKTDTPELVKDRNEEDYVIPDSLPVTQEITVKKSRRLPCVIDVGTDVTEADTSFDDKKIIGQRHTLKTKTKDNFEFEEEIDADFKNASEREKKSCSKGRNHISRKETQKLNSSPSNMDKSLCQKNRKQNNTSTTYKGKVTEGPCQVTKMSELKTNFENVDQIIPSSIEISVIQESQDVVSVKSLKKQIDETSNTADKSLRGNNSCEANINYNRPRDKNGSTSLTDKESRVQMAGRLDSNAESTSSDYDTSEDVPRVKTKHSNSLCVKKVERNEKSAKKGKSKVLEKNTSKSSSVSNSDPESKSKWCSSVTDDSDVNENRSSDDKQARSCRVKPDSINSKKTKDTDIGKNKAKSFHNKTVFLGSREENGLGKCDQSIGQTDTNDEEDCSPERQVIARGHQDERMAKIAAANDHVNTNNSHKVSKCGMKEDVKGKPKAVVKPEQADLKGRCGKRVLPRRKAKENLVYNDEIDTDISGNCGYLFQSPHDKVDEATVSNCSPANSSYRDTMVENIKPKNTKRLLSQSGLYFPELSNASTYSDPYDFDAECEKQVNANKSKSSEITQKKGMKEVGISTSKFFKHRSENRKLNKSSETIATSYMKSWQQKLNKKIGKTKLISQSLMSWKSVDGKTKDCDNVSPVMETSKKKRNRSKEKQQKVVKEMSVYSTTRVSSVSTSVVEGRRKVEESFAVSSRKGKQSKFKLFNPDLSVLMPTEDGSPENDIAEHQEDSTKHRKQPGNTLKLLDVTNTDHQMVAKQHHHRQLKAVPEREISNAGSPGNSTCESSIIENFSAICKSLIEQSSRREEVAENEDQSDVDQIPQNIQELISNEPSQNICHVSQYSDVTDEEDNPRGASDLKSEISWIAKKSASRKKKSQKTYKRKCNRKAKQDETSDLEDAIEVMRFKDKEEDDLIMSSQEWEAPTKFSIEEITTPKSVITDTPKIPSSKRRYSPLDVKFITTPMAPKISGSFHFSDEEEELYVEEEETRNYIVPVFSSPPVCKEYALPLKDEIISVIRSRSHIQSGPSSTIRPSRSSLKRKYSYLKLEDEQCSDLESSEETENKTDDEAAERVLDPRTLFRLENAADLENEKETPPPKSASRRKKSLVKSIPKPVLPSSPFDHHTTTTDEDGLNQFGDLDHALDLSSDIGIESGISTVVQAFGIDIQKQLQAKYKKIQEMTRGALKNAHNHINKVWTEEYNSRSRAMEHFEDKLLEELLALEADVTSLKDAEDKSLIHCQQQKKAMEKHKTSQETRLRNLKLLYASLQVNLQETEECSVQRQENLKQIMKKDLTALQKKLLSDSNQHQMSNVKRCLKSMLF